MGALRRDGSRRRGGALLSRFVSAARQLLRLPGRARRLIEVVAQAALPGEACGVLVGTRADDEVLVVRAQPAANLCADERHDRYELDPGDYLDAERRARAEGLEIVGLWHSHPNGRAKPSETDRREAWEGWIYVIAGVASRRPTELRAWRLLGGRFVEVGIEVCDESG